MGRIRKSKRVILLKSDTTSLNRAEIKSEMVTSKIVKSNEFCLFNAILNLCGYF